MEMIISIELVEQLEEGKGEIIFFKNHAFRGIAITLMTQFDVDKILNIENHIGLKLEEIKFNEDKVLQDMVDITKAIRKIKIVNVQFNIMVRNKVRME